MCIDITWLWPCGRRVSLNVFCPNYTQVDGHQRARWPPTTQSPSHRTRQPSESAMAAYHAMSQLHPSRRPSESTMAAYHTVAFAQNQAAIRERDGRLPRRAACHTGTPPYGQHGPHLAPHPLIKPRGRQAEARQPISTRKAPSQKKAPLFMHLMAEHRMPPTPEGHEGPLGKFSPFTLDPRRAKKGVLGQKAHPR